MRPLAYTIALACWVLLGSGFGLWLSSDRSPTLSSGEQAGQGGLAIAIVYTLTWAEASVVGLLIAVHRRTNPIGWLTLFACSLAAVQSAANGYVTYVDARGGVSPALAPLGWFGSWIGAVALGCIVIALIVFPDGRLPFRWTRPLIILAGVSAVAQAVGYALQPGPLRGLPTLDNPLRLGWLEPVAPLVAGAAAVGLVLSMLAAAGLLAIRLRRARGKERQQLKWIAYAAVLFAIGVGALTLAPVEDKAFGSALFALTGAGLTTAVGIAILRYQMFDIDLLIKGTLVYGCLIVTLGLVYSAGIVLLQVLLSPLTRGSEIAIAASTLAVAALFRPAQHRIRDAIDRRFYRRKYDAARTVEAFVASAREKVDLDTLTAELLALVEDTVQPTRISLWVKDDQRYHRGTRHG
ncbi:MAG TPA: hypothetical protein VGJ60_31420 [Chloroflexota bacterium]|jgi:hypothetical protein